MLAFEEGVMVSSAASSMIRMAEAIRSLVAVKGS